MKIPTHAFVCYGADGVPTEIMGDDGDKDNAVAAIKYISAGGRIERVTLEDARKVRLYERSTP